MPLSSSTIDARVVTGGHERGPEPLGPLGERGELEVAVAVHARDGRPAAGVLAHEVRDHLILELALEIHDVVRDPDARRHAPGIVQVVDRAAGAEADVAPR